MGGIPLQPLGVAAREAVVGALSVKGRRVADTRGSEQIHRLIVRGVGVRVDADVAAQDAWFASERSPL
jgi:hypothetical protein